LIAIAVGFLAMFACVHDRLALHCGLLPASNDQFLDNSGHFFQRCSWHLGDGTRTSGETFGIKIRRAYVTLQITNPIGSKTPAEAREE